MSTYLTQAIPLKLQTLSKSTVLANLYTFDKGKITGIIRGGKKINGKLVNYFNLMAELKVMIAPGKNFDIIAGVDGLKIFENIQTDLEKRILTTSFFDVINRVSGEHEIDQDFYNYLITWLEFVDQTKLASGQLFLTLSLWRLLHKIGFTPNIENCINCHKELSNQSFFSKTYGGIVCKNCRAGSSQPLPENLLEIISLTISNQEDHEIFAAINKANFNNETIRELLDHVEHLLEFEVKGYRVYNQVIKV